MKKPEAGVDKGPAGEAAATLRPVPDSQTAPQKKQAFIPPAPATTQEGATRQPSAGAAVDAVKPRVEKITPE